MQGRRILSGSISDFEPGDYGLVDGRWLCCVPDGRYGDLSNHQITEHEDKTVTVSPSILVSAGGKKGQWHGYLERGVWREV